MTALAVAHYKADYIRLKNRLADPPAPAGGYVGIYPLNGVWYGIDEAGAVTVLGAYIKVRDEIPVYTAELLKTLEVPRNGLHAGAAGVAVLDVVPKPARRKIAWVGAMANAGGGGNIAGTGVGISDPAASGFIGFQDASGTYHEENRFPPNQVGWFSQIFTLFRPDHDPFAMFRMGNTSTDANPTLDTRNVVGLVSNKINSDTPNPLHSAYFRYSYAAGDSNWQFVTSDASGFTAVDTGVVWALDTYWTFAIKFIAGIPYGAISLDYGATWTTFITTGANYPSASQDLGYQSQVMGTATNAKAIRNHSAYFEWD